MEHLIRRLQELKQHQLTVLQRPVVIDNVSLKKREDEVLNNLKDVMKKLSSLGSQKLRLLYILAHENYELFVTFLNEKQSKLQEKIHRRYILFGDNFLIQHIPAHQTLVSWFTEVKQLAEPEYELYSSNHGFPNFSDKHAFNIKYEPLCSRCKRMIGLTKSNLEIYQGVQNSAASMSFSTRRKGFCCRIVLQAVCRLCQILSEGVSDVMAATDGDIKVTIDPWCFDGTSKLHDEWLRDTTAQTFITGNIWPAIDVMTTNVNQR